MLFEGSGHEQTGWRPGVVFQNNVGNAHSPNIIALPLTTSIKKRDMPTHVFISSGDTRLKRDSMVMCENLKCIAKDKVGQFITTLPDHYMKQIAEASLLATSAISFMDIGAILSAWQKAKELNDICGGDTYRKDISKR